jgi:hypothetical protein
MHAPSCANAIITNNHGFQSPIHVPRYYHRSKIHRVFNVMLEALGSCTKIPLDTPLARLVTADPTLGVIERDLSAGAACEPKPQASCGQVFIFPTVMGKRGNPRSTSLTALTGRASASEAEGHRFESCRVRHFQSTPRPPFVSGLRRSKLCGLHYSGSAASKIGAAGGGGATGLRRQRRANQPRSGHNRSTR